VGRNGGGGGHEGTVEAMGERLAVSLDLEVDGALSLGTAHEIASNLEAAVREELGPTVEVETHIEPLQAHGLAGQEAAARRVEEVRAALTELAGGIGSVWGVGGGRGRGTTPGESVTFPRPLDSRRS